MLIFAITIALDIHDSTAQALIQYFMHLVVLRLLCLYLVIAYLVTQSPNINKITIYVPVAVVHQETINFLLSPLVKNTMTSETSHRRNTSENHNS